MWGVCARINAILFGDCVRKGCVGGVSGCVSESSLLMSVRRTSFKDSSTYRSVFTACLLFGDWAYVDVLTSITLLSPE